MSNYAQIREMDISNGSGVGISIFFSGCDFHCVGCFNKELWDYNYGEEFTNETIERIIRLLGRPYVTRISILGGDPLMEENLESVLKLLNRIRISFGNTKTIWLYTGYDMEILLHDLKRKEIIEHCDVVVDGGFEYNKKDLALSFRGSSNQRIINVQQTLVNGGIVLWKL